MINSVQRTLHEIGLSHKLDKAYSHKYTEEFYPRHIESLREAAETVVEIGVWDGGSLRMWSEYFRNARIIGVDINFSRIKAPIERTSLRYADQSSLTDLSIALWDVELGSVDLFIEDGMHSSRCQQICFGAMFNRVRPGGIYIIEDLQSSITWPQEQDERVTTLAMLQKFMRSQKIDTDYMSSEARDYIGSLIDKIDIYTRTPSFDTSVAAVIYRKG